MNQYADREIKRVAVVDDDADTAEMLVETLELAGFESFHVQAEQPSVESLVEQISESADAAVCDHRLSHHGFAAFTGSELGAALTRAGIPTVVVTEFLEQEAVSIRTYREALPVVLRRTDTKNAQVVSDALRASQSELHGNAPRDRRPEDTRIVVKYRDPAARWVDVQVIGWTQSDTVQIALELVPEAMREAMQEGTWFTVESNLNALGTGELYFRNFQMSAPPDPNDGLA